MIDTEQTLHTRSLILEPIVPEHALRLFEKLQSEQLYQYIPQDAPKSVQALANRYKRWAARQSEDGSEIWLNYAVLHRASREYVGTVQATIQGLNRAYIAYEVFPEFWRRGIATESCNELIRYLVEVYEVEEIVAHADTRNVASWKLLESLGLQRTETIEAADQFKGAASNEYVYKTTAHLVDPTLGR